MSEREKSVGLSRREIGVRLAGLPGWSCDGDRLTRCYRLGSHAAAAALVVHIAQVQEDLDHHSHLTLAHDTVSLTLTTHSAGDAVTDKDFELAGHVEALAPAHGAR